MRSNLMKKKLGVRNLNMNEFCTKCLIYIQILKRNEGGIVLLLIKNRLNFH